MQNIKSAVELYLKIDTNYAIMISGEWGTGKTYFYKKTLQPLISTTPILKNSRNYKEVYVSLFGIKSVEDLQTQIFLNLYPLLNKKQVKLGVSVARVLAKGILTVKGFDWLNDLFDIKIDKKEWLEFENLVICFDDLERIDDSLSFSELIGFINSIVEDNNAKVILIANQDKIDKNKYKELKEKVIGNELEFFQDFRSAYENICKERFIQKVDYNRFLDKVSDTITKFFEDYSRNLRILKYALTYYEFIFDAINEITNNSEFPDNLKQSILHDTLKFTLSISSEYKQGEISFNNRRDINRNRDFKAEFLLSITKKTDIESPYNDLFFQKYYDKQKYLYFESIYNFLTGGGELNKEHFKSDLEKLYHFKEWKVLPEYQLLNDLNYNNCVLLSKKEYHALTKKLYKHCVEGKYGFIDSYTAFHYITRFKNPLNYNVNNLKERIISSIEKTSSLIEYHHELSSYIPLPSEEGEYYKQMIEIRDAFCEINEDVRRKLGRKRLKVINELFYSDFEAFLEKLIDKDGVFITEPLFMYFDHKRVYKHVINSNRKVWNLIRLLKIRYRSPQAILMHELTFFKKLAPLVYKRESLYKQKDITGFLWNELKSETEKTILALTKIEENIRT
ncbi:MAG: hypothetical protein KIT80_09610 [Chitinophagaceae bacterium]|nr:hypothetical protein [Chitinophagaceae bacterium]MCW5927155.1 hypothetical protein [Chitinophagaceae bacterium]